VTALLVSLGVTLIAGVFFVNAKIAPIIREMAVARAAILGVRAINDAINDVINATYLTYDDLVMLEKDANGSIAALKTDMVGVNRFKTAITGAVAERIGAIPAAQLKIPLGSLFSGDIVAGRGPGIPFRAVLVGFVEAELYNDFSSAGINQTRHRILLTVTCTVSALLPLGAVGVTVSDQAAIAETVLIGVVPDSYVSIGDILRP